MDVRELAIDGAFEVTPRQFPDARGVFLEWFRADVFTRATGHPLNLAQANTSVSRRGTVRGVHFAQVPPGQAKYVTCLAGSVLDVVVDLRVGSPTFAQHDAVILDDVDRRAVYLAEGLGHVFMSLQDSSVVAYLCSALYTPEREHGVNPLDPELALPWPADVEPLLSPKDLAAPSLAEIESTDLLPRYEHCTAFIDAARQAMALP